MTSLKPSKTFLNYQKISVLIPENSLVFLDCESEETELLFKKDYHTICWNTKNKTYPETESLETLLSLMNYNVIWSDKKNLIMTKEAFLKCFDALKENGYLCIPKNALKNNYEEILKNVSEQEKFLEDDIICFKKDQKNTIFRFEI